MLQGTRYLVNRQHNTLFAIIGGAEGTTGAQVPSGHQERLKMVGSFWIDTEEANRLCCRICKEVEIQAPGLGQHVGRKQKQKKWKLLGKCTR